MDPRDGEVLALANWPRVDANDPGAAPALRAPEPRRRLRPTSRARRSRPSRSPARWRTSVVTARHEVRPRRRRSRSPTARSRESTRAAPRPSPPPRSSPSRATSARSRSACGGQAALRQVGPALRLRHSRPASTCRARSAASSSRWTSTRARRWATCRSARASRSRRCRWRPAYAAIANGGILRTPHVVRRVGGERVADAERPARDLGAGPPPQLRDDARGRRSPRAARRARSRSPATSWPARPARPTRSIPTTGEYSKSAYVASFVGFAPALQPASC